MKRFLLLCLALLLCLSFSGCILDDFSSSDRSKLIKSGEKIFMDYLAKKNPNAKITEMREVTYVGKNHQYQLTDFAEGKYRSGDGEFLFAVNTQTGDIYTSEKRNEFRKKMAAYVNQRLNLQWTAVKANVYPSTILPLKPANPERLPLHNEPLALHGMLPAHIKDMDAYVETALENPALSLSLRFLFTGKPLQPDTVNLARTGKFTQISVELQRFPDSLKPVLEDLALDGSDTKPNWPANNYACLAEETIRFNKNEFAGTVSTFWRWSDYKGAAPFTIHYAGYTHIHEKKKDGFIVTREENFDIAKDLTLVTNENQYEFKTRHNKTFTFYLFLDNLTPVENVKEIAERNRKFHDAAFNESRWHPVLDRWTIGAKGDSSRQLYAMEQNDLIITGKAALEKLGKNKINKEKEKK